MGASLFARLAVQFWREILLALLAFAVIALGDRLFTAKGDYTRMQARVEAKAAQDKADAVTQAKVHAAALKKVKEHYENQLTEVRAYAVEAYRRNRPVWPAATVVVREQSRYADQNGQAANSAGAPDGAGEKQLASGTCEPDERFIKDAAEDALKIRSFQLWIRANGFLVEGESVELGD